MYSTLRSLFYAEGNEVVKQQSDLIRCAFKKEHSGGRRGGMGNMAGLRLRETISYGSHAD